MCLLDSRSRGNDGGGISSFERMTVVGVPASERMTVVGVSASAEMTVKRSPHPRT